MLKIKRVSYEEITIPRENLITVMDAARRLQMSHAGVIRAIERGVLSEVIDDEGAARHGHRLLLADEVEQFAVRRS